MPSAHELFYVIHDYKVEEVEQYLEKNPELANAKYDVQFA